MGFFAKWNSLPVRVRYYIGGSTFAFALIGDYVTGRVNDEVKQREIASNKLQEEVSSSK
ncbi:DEHA2C10076p [Debaryomyces hansenii CBS767]|uniref:DEHA2C10076p n=1 Tax=Debaryomyces hansenii (strain ATCC 36239 / CBS 767 / BCRC 21394 / JCM 1990 / NBRC 0083 / IGC 2968) TaxID=284592 RepID=Q6BUJ7_DEBHA|nr:DEHA2C10076p [Debaryomyces hansenii CBS767]CAG86193.2 DEHA2C10076p [Debaryomyces hansenii CBS767]|eukprot:XP_458122.2 DEHA2C10076p [Debaryomyces hansenii CBS767]